MSQEQDFQEIEEEYEAEENAKHDMRMRRMGEMPVGRLILTMSWPAMIAMLIQAFYNIVDSFFVSMISEQALAAVTYVFPIQMLLISIAIGTGVGINSLISRRLGAKLYEEADMAANHGYRLSFFNWMFFALIGIFFDQPVHEPHVGHAVYCRKRKQLYADHHHRFAVLYRADDIREDPAGNRQYDRSNDLRHHWRCFQYHFRSVVHLRYRTVPGTWSGWSRGCHYWGTVSLHVCGTDRAV